MFSLFKQHISSPANNIGLILNFTVFLFSAMIVVFTFLTAIFASSISCCFQSLKFDGSYKYGSASVPSNDVQDSSKRKEAIGR